jgi:exodeoxyribonuclease V
MLDIFKAFLSDKQAWDMYVEGPAGTGKTTSLRKLVDYCITEEIPYVVCAYTHKACGILRSKLPAGAKVQTLHSFLGKRPIINQDALKLEHVNSSAKLGKYDGKTKLMFVDEYSMVGEKDLCDIRELQDSNYDAIPEVQVVWIGDNHQLPPVGDMQTVAPHGKYKVTLAKQWRNDNPLQTPLNQLIGMIDGDIEPAPLEQIEDYFIRDCNLVEHYKACTDDSVLLAYTNRRVQELNAAIAGKHTPDIGDRVFSPNTQRFYIFRGWVELPDYIDLHYGEPLLLGSKYKTLENIIATDMCKFAILEDEEGDIWQHAIVFGHYDYKVERENFEYEAVLSNKEIEAEYKGYKAAAWAKVNPQHKLARTRAKAWRNCLSFKDCVICIDFPYAMTVHKAQGATFHTVFLDTEDLAICADSNFELYLKLFYVGTSRASRRVYTS